MLRSRSQGQRLRTIEWKGNGTIQAHSLRPIEWKIIRMVQEGRHGGFPHVCRSIKIAMHSARNFHISKNRTPVHDAHKVKYPMHGAWQTPVHYAREGTRAFTPSKYKSRPRLIQIPGLTLTLSFDPDLRLTSASH